MIDLALFTRVRQSVVGRMQSIWKMTGIAGGLVDGIAWLQYTALRSARELAKQSRIATADPAGAVGQTVAAQPGKVTGMTVVAVSGLSPGSHTLEYDGAGMARLDAWPWVAIPEDIRQIDLAPATDTSDPDNAVAEPHFWVRVTPGALPGPTSETVTIIERIGFDFLGYRGEHRNRERYENEAAEHYRQRLINSPGRAVSVPAITLELADLLGYTPRVEERHEEWSGWLIPGLSCVGYPGRTIATESVGPDKGFQPRFRGSHARGRSDAARYLWIHVRAADVDRTDLAAVIYRSRAAGVTAIIAEETA